MEIVLEVLRSWHEPRDHAVILGYNDLPDPTDEFAPKGLHWASSKETLGILNLVSLTPPSRP